MAGQTFINTSVSSPNFGQRLVYKYPLYVILHYTGMADDAQALAWLCNPTSAVSCHYFITRAGEILQLVREEMRAWHAGVSYWRGETDINSASIGIELAHGGHQTTSAAPGKDAQPAKEWYAYPAQQIQALLKLCLDLQERYQFPAENFLGHSDIAPMRKQDPGEFFPWPMFARHGIGASVPAPIQETTQETQSLPLDEADFGMFFSSLLKFGYGLQGKHTLDAFLPKERYKFICAFQRHFRPKCISGIADEACLAIITHLLNTR